MWQQLANTRIMIKLKSPEIRGALVTPVKPEEMRLIAGVREAELGLRLS